MDGSPSALGARAERKVASALADCGWEVYVPLFAPHVRVDLIAVRAERLARIQVKTSVVRNGVVMFRTCSNTGNVPKAYTGEIDAFGVYAPELDRCFLVPSDDLGERGCYLRLVPPSNNQRKGIRYAADYELTPPG